MTSVLGIWWHWPSLLCLACSQRCWLPLGWHFLHLKYKAVHFFPSLKPYKHFTASAVECSAQRVLRRDIRKLSNSNPALKGLPLLVFALTGREESDPSVMGHKRMNREWKLHSFQAKIKPLDNFVSPLMHLKLWLTRPGFSLMETTISFSL